jgi:hypothetical protein
MRFRLSTVFTSITIACVLIAAFCLPALIAVSAYSSFTALALASSVLLALRDSNSPRSFGLGAAIGILAACMLRIGGTASFDAVLHDPQISHFLMLLNGQRDWRNRDIAALHSILSDAFTLIIGLFIGIILQFLLRVPIETTRQRP